MSKQLKKNVKHILAAFPQVDLNKHVFYNAERTEALICVSQDLGTDYIIAVDSAGNTSSANAEWETGYDA